MISYLILTILQIITLSSVNDATAVQYNVSTFVLQLRNEITDTLIKRGIDTSDMQESQCVVVESKLISYRQYLFQSC